MQASVGVALDRRFLGIQAAGLAGVVAAGSFLAVTSLGLPLICPLRVATGVPCPLCGMTTGTVAFLRGDLAGVMAANPFSLGVVPASLVMLGDRIRRLGGGRPLTIRRSLRKSLAWTGVVMIVASWVFQLVRFGIV